MRQVRNFRDTLASLQERTERSVAGQVGISAVIAVIVLTSIIYCMPDSAIRRDLIPVAEPVGTGLGLDQNWGVFAPNPPGQTETVTVDITMSDGSVEQWKFPRADVVDQFAAYRWRTVKERLVRVTSLRADFCHWVIRHAVKPSAKPVQVQMILRTEQLLPPGSHDSPKVGQQILYNEKLAG